MIKIVSISLENEMDLVLAHKRSMKVAERLGLTIATQTTFATAVSEIARTVIEHTDDGLLDIGLEQNKTRYNLVAKVTFNKDILFTNADAGFYYAQKLVPEFELKETETGNLITMKMSLPRSLKLEPVKINLLKSDFAEELPINAYEDIKQRHATLNKIATEQEEELRQSKLVDEKKTEFISIASHELKTPMTILKAYTQMAKATAEPMSEHLLGLLNKIDLQSNKLMTLVQQLLDISKIENGNLQYNMSAVSVNTFLHDQVAVMRHILPYHKFVTNFGEDADVLIDELRLEQVLANLLGNAGKYSDKYTDILISTSLLIDKGVIMVSITDQGRGMTAETTASIFNKFYRAKDVLKSHTGLGVGLFITSKIITDHQGEIWVESADGNGSTFYFTIPLATKI
ncbi:sensor histidine kinase [Mucilaginibacter gotjawali]|uniref:histidine kinase n=2 Tax=Mucilaginibacter gotjawali TaxID=1550579 RepID=A0A110B2P2_9SPHI|nr:sensor histidine kinase [Mucilaginibacter gotjawali]MBB3054027.1 signal transduction histidine kinase [Mucilaginibacter gotjawali]BAU54293.1 Sensor histidine kinase YycG [Mucilaginibacter gotjawali]